MSYIKYLLLLLLIPTFTRSDDLIFDMGIGTFNTSSQMRMFSIGVQEDLWTILKQRGTIGAWADSSAGSRASGFVAGQLGFEIENNGWVGSIFSGPGAITSPDQILGGVFQFMSDASFGFHDRERNYIGVNVRHFSSAGIEMPNAGRTTLGLELKFPF